MGQKVVQAPEEFVEEVMGGFVRNQKEEGFFLNKMMVSNTAELGEFRGGIFDGEKDDVHR